MPALHVWLFGKLRAQNTGLEVEELDSSKMLELFCFFLLHRERSYSRETLASLLWPEYSTAQSKKYLRQALWQLHKALENPHRFLEDSLLVTRLHCIQLNPGADLWLDVAIFERALALVQGRSGQQLDARAVQALQEGVSLYQGDLLEGWYQDWCLAERERLQRMYLVMLDKLISYCEVHGQYEAGLDYGERSLRCDRARERTYQQLMRLNYLAGDRATALQQYKRCVAALDEELGVQPGKSTRALYAQLRADQLAVAPLIAHEGAVTPIATDGALSDVLASLKQLRTILDELQHGLEQHCAAEPLLDEEPPAHALPARVLAAVPDAIAH